MKFSEQLLHYFHHRLHAGALDSAIPSVRSVQVGRPENREVLLLMIDYRDRIQTARFKAAGSVALIAGAEFICGWLEQKSWPDLQSITPEFILKSLGLTPLHTHIANLIVLAVQQLPMARNGTN